MARVNDATRGRRLSVLGMALSLGRNYEPFKSPTHFKLSDLLKKFDKTFGATGKSYGNVGKDRTMADIEHPRRDRWNFLFIAGMWFQDLFNYDFRRTEHCIIPYATHEGEISFCAYNTGIGWRNIIEKMHMTATLSKWYEQHGRHEIFAGGKHVPLKATDHSLVLRDHRRAARPRQAGHRQDGARGEDPGPRRQAEGAGRKPAHDEALPLARTQGTARGGAGADWRHSAGRARIARGRAGRSRQLRRLKRAGAPPPLHQDRPRPGVKPGRGSDTDYFFFFFVAAFFLATDGAAGACAVSRPASEAPSGDPSPLQASQPGPAL